MERSVGSIVTKIDAVIVKLEGMEKNKAKKREAMTRILEQMDDEEGGKWHLSMWYKFLLRLLDIRYMKTYDKTILFVFFSVNDERRLSDLSNAIKSELASLEDSTASFEPPS